MTPRYKDPNSLLAQSERLVAQIGPIDVWTDGYYITLLWPDVHAHKGVDALVTTNMQLSEHWDQLIKARMIEKHRDAIIAVATFTDGPRQD